MWQLLRLYVIIAILDNDAPKTPTPQAAAISNLRQWAHMSQPTKF